MFTPAHRRQAAFLAGCDRIALGSLRLRTPDGAWHDFGHGDPSAELVLHDWAAVTATLSRGAAGLAETYAAGLWDTPSVESLAALACLNRDRLRGAQPARFWQALRTRTLGWFTRRGPRAARFTPSDAGNEFFQLWLDPGLSSSAALFAPGDGDLLRAQNRKHDRILDRFAAGGERLLDLGCGWGALAERAADRGHQVTGFTALPGQRGFADARLDGRAEILLGGPRQATGAWDAVVAVEIDTSLPGADRPALLATLKACLAEGGRAVLQTTTRAGAGSGASLACLPRLDCSQPAAEDAILRAAAAAGLACRDRFAFGADYARTCRLWAERLDTQAGRALRHGYDQPFLRRWRLALGAAAAAFATGEADVVQLEFTHA
jgi:cyclopropane-fatty-acyl-phospholipid synthase